MHMLIKLIPLQDAGRCDTNALCTFCSMTSEEEIKTKCWTHMKKVSYELVKIADPIDAAKLVMSFLPRLLNIHMHIHMYLYTRAPKFLLLSVNLV